MGISDALAHSTLAILCTIGNIYPKNRHMYTLTASTRASLSIGPSGSHSHLGLIQREIDTHHLVCYEGREGQIRQPTSFMLHYTEVATYVIHHSAIWVKCNLCYHLQDHVISLRDRIILLS